MNINRHNYEEFFLLYADNELPADLRRAVEDFVQQNADLKEELNLLLELHLEPDTSLLFTNKESLLQPVLLHDDAAPISEDEEKMLRLIDHELSLAETLSEGLLEGVEGVRGFFHFYERNVFLPADPSENAVAVSGFNDDRHLGQRKKGRDELVGLLAPAVLSAQMKTEKRDVPFLSFGDKRSHPVSFLVHIQPGRAQSLQARPQNKGKRLHVVQVLSGGELGQRIFQASPFGQDRDDLNLGILSRGCDEQRLLEDRFDFFTPKGSPCEKAHDCQRNEESPQLIFHGKVLSLPKLFNSRLLTRPAANRRLRESPSLFSRP